VRLGTLDPEVTAPTKLNCPTAALTLEPLVRRQAGRLGSKDFDPCTILLNNDLSGGLPAVLADLHEQYLLPPLHAGWAVRRKSQHFQAYEEVAKKFAKLLGMDPVADQSRCSPPAARSTSRSEGWSACAVQCRRAADKIRRKYKEYGINEKPFVVVKADNGTYGMGIMTVRDAKEVDATQPPHRNKMSVVKEGQQVTEVIIQEGVPTYERSTTPWPSRWST
jgi:glutamate--cysteine ligase